MRVAGLPWQGPTACEVLLLDAQHDLAPISSRPVAGGAAVVEQDLRRASVYVVTLKAAEKSP